MSDLKDSRPYLSIEDVAEILGVNHQAIRRQVHIGRLKAIKVGRLHRIRREDFEAWMEASVVEPKGDK